MKTIDKAFLEQTVLDIITNRFNNPEAIGMVADKIASKQAKSTPAMNLMWTQLNDVERRLANVMKAIEAGVVNDTTKARMEELEATKKTLQESMAEENLLHRAYTRDEIMFMLTRLLAPHPKDLREKKLVIRLFLDSAVLFPDGMLTCNMNWLKGKKPIDINVFLRDYKDSTLASSCSPY